MNKNEIIKETRNVFNLVKDKIFYLADRWSSEKEYEDINDYEKEIQKLISQKILKMYKRPFGFKIKIDNFSFSYTVILDKEGMRFICKPCK